MVKKKSTTSPKKAIEEEQDSDVAPLEQRRPSRSVFLKECRKEARAELEAAKHPRWKTTEDGPSITEHFASTERLMGQLAISTSSPTAYYMLLYSLDSTVRDSLPPCDLSKGNFEDLYDSLKNELHHQYQDPADVSQIRAEFNNLQQKQGESVASFFQTVDHHVTRLRLLGDVVTNEQLYDLLCGGLLFPYHDWMLAYRLEGIGYERARVMVLSRSRQRRRPQAQDSQQTLHDLWKTPVVEVHSVKTEDSSNVTADTSQAVRPYVDYDKLRREARCLRCFQRGHTARDCSNPLPQLLEARCLCCGRTGHASKNCRLAARNKQLTCVRCGGLHHVPAICRGRLMQNDTTKEVPKEETTAAAATEDRQDREPPTTNAYSLLPTTDATWLAHSSDKPQHSMPLTVDMDIIPVIGDKEPKTLRMLLDTGAARSFVAEDWRVNNTAFIHGTREEEVDVMLADKRRFTAKQSVLLYVSPPGKTEPLPIWCLVSSSLSTPVIPGMASLRSLRLMLYLSPDSVLLKSGVPDSAIRSLSSSTREDTGCRAMTSDKEVSLSFNASESQFGEKQVGLDLMLLCEPECPQSMLCSVLTERMPPEFSDLEGPTLSSSERGLEDSPSPISEDGDNKTLFVGLTTSDHLTIDGQNKEVSRYTYSIPWLADRRPVVPDRRMIEKAIQADRKFCDRLQESGHLDAYSAVFDKYLQNGIIEVVPPEHYDRCKALLRHFAVHSDSRTTPVRPVLDGRAFAGLIGSGLGNKNSKDRVLRSTLKALGGFRLYKCAATLDVTMAFYMLLHTYDDSFYFCIPFRGRLYRLRAPPMGGPHSPGCLLDAMQRLCDEALSDFVCLYPHLVKNGLVPVCFCFYMDDLVVGADTPQLLNLAIRCLLKVCDRHGFNCSEKKRQIGPPEGADAAHVLGLQWNKNDQICIVLPDPSSLPPPYSCPSSDNLLAVTIRDLMGYVARIYNPLGFIGHMLLAMRLVVKEELDRTVSKDLDTFITIPSYDSILRLTEDLARFPGIPRVLSVRQDPTICVFMDASGFGYGIVVTDSLFNIIRCNSKIISGPRRAWSIVKKELYALQQSVIFYKETCLALLSVDKALQLVPQFYTDNAANYFRLRKAMQYVEEDDSSQPWPPKHLDIRPWEAKVLLQLAKDIKDLHGSVYHLAGRHNPADAFSRGTTISVLPQVDEGLKLAVEVARRREGLSYAYDYEADYKLEIEECLCTIQLSDSETPVSLKEAIISMQYEDSTLGKLLDSEKFGCPDPRLLRKYSVIYPRDGTPKYVVNAVTDGLAVPYGRQSDVVKALHLFYSHLGSHKLYKSTVHDFDCGSLKNFVSCQHDCEVCRVQRGYRSLSHRLGRSLSRTDRAWEVLNVDLIGPFMQKDRVVYDLKVESTMCLVLVDSYTGFLAYSVLQDYAPAIEVAKSLDGICLDHQYPKAIVSDNDSRFCSVPVSSWALGMGIRWATVPPHCSRWNGWAESKHKLINYFLRVLLTECGYDKASWYNLMGRVIFLCNSVTRPSLSASLYPSSLHYVHGRGLPPSMNAQGSLSPAAAAFLDKNIPLKMPSNDELEHMILDYSQRLTEDSKWVAVDAENLDATLRSRKVLADESVLRSNFDTLKVGNSVLRFNYNRNKLDPYWNPVVYKVISIRGQIAAITSDPLRARPFFEYIGNLKRIEV